MPTPMTLAMDEPEPKIASNGGYLEPRIKKATYAIGFLDGIIASSVTYIVITLIALFIGSYQ